MKIFRWKLQLKSPESFISRLVRSEGAFYMNSFHGRSWGIFADLISFFHSILLGAWLLLWRLARSLAFVITVQSFSSSWHNSKLFQACLTLQILHSDLNSHLYQIQSSFWIHFLSSSSLDLSSTTLAFLFHQVPLCVYKIYWNQSVMLSESYLIL